MCKKEVLSLPAGDTHALITRFGVYSAPQHRVPLQQRGSAETAWYAFRQGRKPDPSRSGQMNEVYTLVHALFLNPMLQLQPQLAAIGVVLTGDEIKRLLGYMQFASGIDACYKASQWFHILQKHCDLPHKPRPSIKNNEHPMYFPIEVLRHHRRPTPCTGS